MSAGRAPLGAAHPDATSAHRVRTRLRVEGIVQGVGFRPFVYGLARRLRLAGLVGNDLGGVFIEVEGPASVVAAFIRELEHEAPPLAVIERVTAEDLHPEGGTGFVIAGSRGGGPNRTLISPDVATCAGCLRELFDPADRRHRYPFINCTDCGPRFTIIRNVPYDRSATTMSGFPMCPACAAEYRDPVDRRFHAEPTCCPACGPSLALTDPGGRPLPGDPLTGAADLLRDGAVVAVKGLGGYHLAVDATNERAARTLRSRKHREDKPFAVMTPDLAAAESLCEVDEAARRLLTGDRRPIVLLPRVPGGPVAASVAPGNRDLGVMLPYTPLHHLLCDELSRPYVLTSGNVSDEPIVFRDDEVHERLGGIADAFLGHDRPIHTRTDDSVIRVRRGRATPVRRSRGYAPEPLPLHPPARRPILACGAELKNTFCLARGDRAFVSHHIGDLENYETLRSFTEGIAHFRRLFDVEPEVVAYDLHPEYLSTKYALDLADQAGAAAGRAVELVGIQHHHAHIASCLADNGAGGPVIGVAFDGLGYGTDGTLWGGEFLVADLCDFVRVGHLAPVPLPGGTKAIREPWRMAAAYLSCPYPPTAGGGLPSGGNAANASTAAGDPGTAAGDAGTTIPAGLVMPAGLAGTAGLAGGARPVDTADLPVRSRRPGPWRQVVAMAGAGVNSPPTSSAGRLFDAVAALLDIRDTIVYEGQAAVELEQRAIPGVRESYPAGVLPPAQGTPGGPHDHGGPAPFQVRGADLVEAALADLRSGEAVEVISARFHNGVADMIVECCARIRDETGLTTVALSGGVFQNRLLVDRTVPTLESRGFTVLTHRHVPPNDGGISLGQAAIAAARDAASQPRRS